jgi:hypothetical protein
MIQAGGALTKADEGLLAPLVSLPLNPNHAKNHAKASG